MRAVVRDANQSMGIYARRARRGERRARRSGGARESIVGSAEDPNKRGDDSHSCSSRRGAGASGSGGIPRGRLAFALAAVAVASGSGCRGALARRPVRSIRSAIAGSRIRCCSQRCWPPSSRASRSRRLSRRLFCVLFAATASHGILDAFTDGGLGIGFLIPLRERALLRSRAHRFRSLRSDSTRSPSGSSPSSHSLPMLRCQRWRSRAPRMGVATI